MAPGQPVTPHSLETTTMRPAPRRRMPGRTACTQVERAAEVGVDHLPPVVQVVLQERGHGHVGVVGDEHVDVADLPPDLGHQRLDLRAVADVAGHADAADLVGERLQVRRGGQVVDRDDRAVAGEPSGVRGAHALPGAGDQGHPAGQDPSRGCASVI